MSNDYLTTKIIPLLTDYYKCHSALLYGSRASGDYSDDSDFDVLAFSDQYNECHINSVHDGLLLDIFIFSQPPSDVNEILRIHGGIVLFEKDSCASDLLKKVSLIRKDPPAKLDVDKINEIRNWLNKMQLRSSGDDVHSHYRRIWLLYALLEDYFLLRGIWFDGPKKSLNYLRETCPAVYESFRNAYIPSATTMQISKLVDIVIDVD